jgi:hypothetical protein
LGGPNAAPHSQMGEIFCRLIRVATDKSIQKLVLRIIPPSTIAIWRMKLFAKRNTISDNLLTQMRIRTLNIKINVFGRHLSNVSNGHILCDLLAVCLRPNRNQNKVSICPCGTHNSVIRPSKKVTCKNSPP